MSRQKKQPPKKAEIITPEEFKSITKDYQKQIETDPKYSLEVDPEDKYDMSEIQKSFIKTYCEVKNIIIAAQMLNIEESYAMQLFGMYSSQKEINRINMAKLHRRINTKMWDYTQIGGYLTTLLTDDNVPLSERLSQKDKLQVVDRLIDLNERLAVIAEKPYEANSIEIDNELKDLSVEAIKALLEQDSNKQEKDKVISRIKTTTDLTAEEEALLKTMSLKELLALLNQNGEQ